MPSDLLAAAVIRPDVSRDTSFELYGGAVRQYAENVANRAVALYQVGNVSFPGLSDIDLLLIPDGSRFDNAQYFSAYERLRASYLKVFLHEPFVLPADMLDLIAHTSHSKRVLLTGRDILGDRSPTDRMDERWCKLFESYCNYRLFVDNVARHPATSGRLLVAVASSMRYALSDLDTLAGTASSAAYSSSVDDLRRRILTENDSAPLLQAVWVVFLEAVRLIESTVCGMLSLESNGLVTFARAFLAGNRALPGVDADFIRERRRSIDAYYAALRRLRLPFGSLFYAAAYDNAALRYSQPFIVKLVCKSYYRIRQATSA